MRHVAAALVLGVFLLGTAGTALAQEDERPGDKVVYKKKTVIDLTGAVIEGTLTKPEGTYVVSRKASRFSKLITLRENFIPELINSPDQL